MREKERFIESFFCVGGERYRAKDDKTKRRLIKTVITLMDSFLSTPVFLFAARPWALGNEKPILFKRLRPSKKYCMGVKIPQQHLKTFSMRRNFTIVDNKVLNWAIENKTAAAIEKHHTQKNKPIMLTKRPRMKLKTTDGFLFLFWLITREMNWQSWNFIFEIFAC